MSHYHDTESALSKMFVDVGVCLEKLSISFQNPLNLVCGWSFNTFITDILFIKRENVCCLSRWITTSSSSSRAFITDRTTTTDMSVEKVCSVLQGLLNLSSDSWLFISNLGWCWQCWINQKLSNPYQIKKINKSTNR